MKSGLYACAGASATASAAAWAKRFDEPMTNESNVYFALKPPLSGRPAGVGPWERRLPTPRDPPSRLAALGDAELERALVADDVAHRGADQAEEVPLDPVARELARDGEHERVAVELETADVTEPLAVRPVAERLLEPPGDLLPEVLCRQLDLVLHRRPDPPRLRPGGQHNSGFDRGKIAAVCREFPSCQQSLHRCGQSWGQLASSRIAAPSAAVDKPVDEARLY